MKSYRDIAFTAAVETVQESRGSRALYARVPGRVAPEALSEDEIDFIRHRNGFYVASINADGWPYVQHRGGPRGFVRVTGPAQLAFADYAGNRQYLTTGNPVEDDRVALFFMDYAERVRLKAFARARTVEAADAAPELLDAVVDPEYRARVERVMIFDVEATSWNCQQHIVQRLDPEEIDALVQPLHERIAELEAQLAAARLEAVP